MVGIPGRSKGCRTCLRRRIKCDEEQPGCQRCKRAGYKCEGYERAQRFINQTPTSRSSSRDSSVMLRGPSSAPEDTQIASAITTRMTFNRTPAPRELDLSAFEDDVVFACLFENYVHGNFGTPWLNMAADGSLSLTAFEAARALAKEFFSQYHQLPAFKTEASKHYGQSLSLLRSDFGHVNISGIAETLIVPIMVLIMYDFLTYADGVIWDHHDGLLNLLEFCGPQCFQREPPRSAFETCREILVSRALQERKRIFLERIEWKTEPWAADPTQKTPANELLDMLADIPGLLEDEAMLMQNETPTGVVALRSRVLAHLGLLYEWRWAFEARNPGCIAQFQSMEPAEGRPFPGTRLQYKSFTHINELNLYNAIQLWLIRMLSDLMEGGPDRQDVEVFFANVSARRRSVDWPPSPLLLPGDAGSVFQVAVEMCRLFECQKETFRENKDIVLAWLLPMGLAYQVLGRAACGDNTETEKAVLNWATNMLESMPVSFRHACSYISTFIRLFR